MGSSSSKRKVHPAAAPPRQTTRRSSDLPDIPDAGEPEPAAAHDTADARDAKIPEEPARDYYRGSGVSTGGASLDFPDFPAVSRRGSATLPPLPDTGTGAGTQSRRGSAASQTSVSLRLVHLAAKQKVKRKKLKLSRAEDAIVKLRLKQADLLRTRVALMEKLRRQSEDMQAKLWAKEESLAEQLKDKEATIFRQNSVTIATGMIERAHSYAEMQAEQVGRNKLRQKRDMKEKMAARRQHKAQRNRASKTRRGSRFGFFGGKKGADKAPASPAGAEGGRADAAPFPGGGDQDGGQGVDGTETPPAPTPARKSRFSLFGGTKGGPTRKERRASRQAARESVAASSAS